MVSSGPTDADVVVSQYQRWQYPEPVEDLDGWLVNNWQWFDPSHAHRLLWPDRPHIQDMDILVAGCGTNQAAVLAYTNPEARITAIDVSGPSLDHQRHLKDKYSLGNLDLRLLPIEEVGSLSLDFDLIVSTGVLHHLADPDVGMRALADCLRIDGVAAIMVYATHGRDGVELMQGVFRDLGLRQDSQSLEIVKDALRVLPADHPVRRYLAVAPDVSYDAGLVDTFLHGRDRSFTVPDCLNLIENAGLTFQDWLFKSNYYPPNDGGTFYRAVASVEPHRQWALAERINTSNACHFFTACRPDRSPATYRVDFSSAAVADYVPVLRYRCKAVGTDLVRPGGRRALTSVELAFVQRIDTARTIAEITEQVGRSGIVADVDGLTTLGANIFERLWQQDFIAIDLSRLAR
ncbi:class I SAM-dependent methyltransferase [Mycolicibacterium sarraceniae]|uniref:Methyltransferase type 12 domain-containing protein n=1 Tax=Mycolicibacterium sarraceniae TaxID=1534348 RepID=A0A7I7SZQ8_9MYCO|nr:class I SAM-dependent methyltransferase [Mycolicibacterium sarraceniae]BBY61689.1 hypothetical protein MSAR_48250 [Mycolicibacterium sarraceniae]